MIFVTVGTHSQGFDRLIQKMDEIAEKSTEKVIMQVGSTTYKPKNAEYFEFTENNQLIRELNKKARLVVCHGGAGAIITALDQGTPVIAIPRRKKYHEHVNDHQLELVQALEKSGKITALYDIEELENALNLAVMKSKTNVTKENALVTTLRSYIDNLGT
ncbi:MAG: beta-1,4-galactosyltransferase [Candidatus Thermoplasmatota archaeon]|nr:beta-1,4-galactosyltransferase [Candidatus Thermoplasmatota archaeon]